MNAGWGIKGQKSAKLTKFVLGFQWLVALATTFARMPPPKELFSGWLAFTASGENLVERTERHYFVVLDNGSLNHSSSKTSVCNYIHISY